jgi:hypothetical protein
MRHLVRALLAVTLIALIVWAVIASLALRGTRSDVRALQHQKPRPATVSAATFSLDFSSVSTEVEDLQARIGVLEHAQPSSRFIPPDNSAQVAQLTTEVTNLRTTLDSLCAEIHREINLGDYACPIL